MTGSCDDCARLMTWENRVDFEGHGGEMMSDCGLSDHLMTDDVCELADMGRCPFWKPIEVESLTETHFDIFKETHHERMRVQRDMPGMRLHDMPHG